MQKRENPYTPGAGRKPPNLAGRDRDLENFQSLIVVRAGNPRGVRPPRDVRAGNPKRPDQRSRVGDRLAVGATGPPNQTHKLEPALSKRQKGTPTTNLGPFDFALVPHMLPFSQILQTSSSYHLPPEITIGLSQRRL
jgi:hypothetical protein